jgi:hypothetical protein
MPRDTSRQHTIESVGIVISRLEAIVAQLEVSKTLMEVDPPLSSLEVNRQTSLDTGLAGLRAWADSLRDCVDQKRMDLASNGVSGGDGDTHKQRKKKL